MCAVIYARKKMNDSMSVPILPDELAKAFQSAIEQAQHLSPQEGNGWSFGLTVILIVVAVLALLVFVGGGLFVKFVKTIYLDHKSQRKDENEERKQHGEKVTEKLKEIGDGFTALNSITQLHEKEITDIKIAQANHWAEITILKNTAK